MRIFDHIKIIGAGLVYFLIQILILKEVNLFDSGFLLLYIAILLFLPLEIGVISAMFIAFGLGFIVDIFYNSPGIHASACLTLIFVREWWKNVITPQGGYDLGAIPSIGSMGFNWFIIYLAPLVLVHHLVLFFIEAGGASNFWFTLSNVLVSFLINTLLLVLIQMLFYSKKGR